MGKWTLEDIPWDTFDPEKVDPKLVPLVKAASMVEYNSGDYRTYLKRVFAGDAKLCHAIDGWAEEEAQHGLALAEWAKRADETFNFEASFKRFTDGFRLPLEATASVRGSRSGELIARCMVETGTNSFYTALADAADEPVLKTICRNIADDEHAHYHLFHHHLTRHLDAENLDFRRRMMVAWERIAESEDDELAYAYYAANGNGLPYDRRTFTAAFGSVAMGYYTPDILRRSVQMIFRAVGLNPDGTAGRIAGRLGWWWVRAQRLRFRAAIFLTKVPPNLGTSAAPGGIERR